jgi:hypothetical protein
MTDKQNNPVEYQGKSGSTAKQSPDDVPTEKINKVDKKIDKTLEDSFPASDPPSSIPTPEDEEEAA